MSRSYAGTITLNSLGDFRARRVIRESGTVPDHGGVDRIARNLNTIYAQWSPTIVAQHTSDSSSRYFMEYSAGLDESLLAYRFRCPGDTAPQSAGLTADIWARVTGVTTGRITVKTINGAGTGSVDHTGTSFGWQTLASGLAYAPDAGGREIVVVSGYRQAGAGTPALRHVHLRYLPYTGGASTLPSGVYASGLVAADLAQYAADQPLSAGSLKALEAQAGIMRGMWPVPIGAQAWDLREPVTSKSHPTNVDKDYGVMVWRCPFWRRPGEGVEEVAYSLLGQADPGGAGGVALVRVTYQGVAISKSAEVALPTAIDPTDSADWLDGTLDVSRVPERPSGREHLEVEDDGTLEPAWVEVILHSNTAGDDCCLYSVSVQEEPR